MVILHGSAHPRINIKNTKQKHIVPIIFHEEKEAYARPFRNVYQIISYKFLHLSTFEEIEHKYLTRFSKYNFRQPPVFVNYDNTHYFLGDRNYGIQFYRRLTKTFQSLSFLKFKSKENFFLMTMRWIVSRSKKLTRSNSFILLLKALGDKV